MAPGTPPWPAHPLIWAAAMLVASCTDRDDTDEGGSTPEHVCVGPGAGGGASVDGPPELTATSMIDRSTIRLSFTEAMGPVGDIDPSAFRLSMGMANMGDFYGTLYTALAQSPGSPCPPMEGVDECCYEICGNDGCEPMCVPASAPIEVIGVCDDEQDSAALTLHLSAPIDEYTCAFVEGFRYLNEMYGQEYGGGLFVHYTDNKIPVTDARGEPLAPIAEHWALTDEAYGYASPESFPDLDPWLPIFCP